MRRAALILGALSGLPAIAAQAADGPAKPPYELVRELQVFQNKSVLGGTNAQAEHREQIVKAAKWLRGYDAKVWADPKNARAAVIYVLSGGDSRVLRKLTGASATLGIDDKLVKGALAYGERRDAAAIELLGGVDLNALDRSIAGHVALVRALLVANDEPRKAFALLDMARVVAPGTIIEESALRRQAILAAKMGEMDEFEALGSQYFRRFADSIFAYSFQRQFAQQIAAHAYAGDDERMAKLEALLGALPVRERIETCLALAEEAIVVANVEVVRLAAKMAPIDAMQRRADSMRLKLFEAAAVILTPDYDQGVAVLRTLDRTKLGAREEGLLNAALAVAREISRLPQPVRVAETAPPTEPAPAPGREPEPAENAEAAPSDTENASAQSAGVVREAEEAMARVDKLLSETAQ
jgi:chemotaxis protein MotC